MYRIGSLRHSDAKLYNIDEVAWSNKDINVLGVIISHENIVEKNYDGIVQKAKQVLDSWYHRNLTLIGRVQVVNTLVASLFVYKMMVLPSIPLSIVRNVDNIIREFIWNKRKAKIAYRILQNPKTEGGLNLVNLTKKDQSLKATWPYILYQEEEYAKIVYGLIRCTDIQEDIWRCNLHPEDVSTMGIKSEFWYDVLKAWCEYNYYHDTRVDNQIIWYNSKIKVGGKIVMWTDIFRNNLMYVYQLFQGGKYKSFQLVKEQYGLTKIRYNQLKSAIPSEWKAFFVEQECIAFKPLAPSTYDKMLITSAKGFSRKVYKFLLGDVIDIHNKYMGWHKELGEDPCGGIVEFGLKHSEIYRLTNITKYRSFQYRLLQKGYSH